MNAKKLSFLLLILVAVACTNRSTSSEQDEMRHWNNVLQQINALLLENKARQTLDLAKQTLPEILESAEKNGTTDTLIYYARKIFNACGNNYINTKQYKDGIDYMDSIGNHPLIREHCPHELLSFKAGLNQLYGNNPEAVRLAEDYLQLPVCTSANDFIRQAEIISGVYMYSGNNLPKAIQILEKAIDVYRKGGNFPNMLRIMSRLGIYYHLSGEYEKAIATNQEAIATYNDSIAPGNVVIAYGEQANLYAELGMYDQALEMNKKAQYYSMLKDSFGLGDLYRYRAQIFRNMNQKDSVFHYLRLGEKLSMIQNSFKGVFVNKVETVNSYLDYPDSLEKALQLALSICPDTVRMPQWAKYQLNLHLGRALLQSGKEQNGIHLIDRAAQDLINMKFMEGRDANDEIMVYLAGADQTTAKREGAKRHTPDRPGCTRPHQHEVHGRPRCQRKRERKQTALGTSAMAATAVVLQHLHLHYITVATYHHYSLFHHPKEGQPPAYRKQQTGNTDPHYPAARPEPPQRTTDGRNRTGHGYQ